MDVSARLYLTGSPDTDGRCEKNRDQRTAVYLYGKDQLVSERHVVFESEAVSQEIRQQFLG